MKTAIVHGVLLTASALLPAFGRAQSPPTPQEQIVQAQEKLAESQGRTKADTPKTCDGALASTPQKRHFGFHIPPKVQARLDEAARKLGNKTGVDVDSHAPNAALIEAQTKHPCTSAAQGASK